MKFLRFKNRDEKVAVGKILCVGRNYAKHAEELGNEVPKFPIIFLKTATSLIPSGGQIIHPVYSNDMHHEVELVLYIGKDIKNANDEEAEDAIAGYAVGLDMTLRDLQSEYKKKGNPWTLAKVFDTSGVLTDIVLKDDYSYSGSENIYLNVNGEPRQSSSLTNMVFPPVEVVKYLSKKMTLEKGDLIFTGTPEGVDKVGVGDKLEGGIDGIGIISADIIEDN